MSKDYRTLEQKIVALMVEGVDPDRNTKIRMKVTNVGRPDTAPDNFDPRSRLAKQGEIKTKIIDEAEDKDAGEVDDKKKKKDAKADDVDAKEVKGGKTEVDLNPTTDDKMTTDKEEDAASSKARKKVNKEIGAKGAVKESQMFKSDKNLGIADSIIEAAKQVMKEKLVGAQHKIDKNKNGKIDAHDFKLLRKEESEENTEEQIDELSKKTLGSYVKKASDDMSMSAYSAGARAGAGEDGTKSADRDRAVKRLRGVKKATDKLTKEEIEQVDEISKKTLGSYVNKAVGQVQRSSFLAAKDKPEKSAKHGMDAYKRMEGIRKATERLAKEEVEQVDELSKKTLGSYVKGAKDDKDMLDTELKHTKDMPKNQKDMFTKQQANRGAGIALAKKKMAKEEVELSAEEIARIEEISKKFD